MTRAATFVLVAATMLLPSCEARPEQETVTLGSLRFDVPLGWHRSDTTRRGLMTSEWTPDDNTRRESVVVMRSELSPAVAKAGGIEGLQQLLTEAQGSLPRAHASAVTALTTQHGLWGARVGVDFMSAETKGAYHREHVVLVDDNDAALVHVIYTAKDPDPKRDALGIVLRSIRHKES